MAVTHYSFIPLSLAIWEDLQGLGKALRRGGKRMQALRKLHSAEPVCSNGSGSCPHQPLGGFGPRGAGHMENMNMCSRSLRKWSGNQRSIWPPSSFPPLHPWGPPSSSWKDQCPCFWPLAQAVTSARSASPPFSPVPQTHLKGSLLIKRTLQDTK